MESKLRERIDLFLENNRRLKESLKHENPEVLRMIAILDANDEKTSDPDKLKACKQILKENESWSSIFRGNMTLPMAYKLSRVDNPEKFLLQARECHAALKGKRIFDSEFLGLAATILASSENGISHVDQIKELYGYMKKYHPFLTDDFDLILASNIVCTNRYTSTTVEDMERAYGMLHKMLKSYNPVQTLSHIVTLFDEDVTSQCDRIVDLYHGLAENKMKPNEMNMMLLGSFAGTSMDTEDILAEILDGEAYLKSMKGIRTNKQGRLLYMLTLTAGYFGRNTADIYFSYSMLQIILTQMMVCQMILMYSVAVNAAAANS